MRMPKPKHNHSMIKWTKRTWKLFTRNRTIEDFSNPPDMPPGSKIYDAVEFVTPLREKLVFPAPYAKEPIYLNNSRNPDWNARILHYDQDTRIIEGYKQSLVLFKTVLYRGLPAPVQSLVGRVELKGADELLKKKLLSEYCWSSSQELLPIRKDPEIPWYNFPRDYGVTLKRKVSGLENQIWNLCSIAAGSVSCQRHKLLEPYAKVFLEREGQRVLCEVVNDAVILGSEPLAPFDPNPDSTQEQALEDIYPLSSLVDLQAHHIYKEGNVFCVGSSCKKKFCHTLLLSDTYEKKWLEKQVIARAIACCFTFAASQAVNVFGPNVKRLPEPVSINCLMFQEKDVSLLSYQLNTLDLDGDDALKNQVWLDGPHRVFESYSERDGIVGYNPTVFPKALALSLNGLKL